MRKPKHRVEIEWVDSSTTDAWTDLDDAISLAKLVAVRSAGYIVKETDEVVVLAGSLHENNSHAFSLLCIPRQAIKSIRKLKPKNKYETPQDPTTPSV